jgi:hypothetical protein
MGNETPSVNFGSQLGYVPEMVRAILFLRAGFALSQGADAEQIIRHGGRWSGFDLTLHELSYEEIDRGSALDMPSPAFRTAGCSESPTLNRRSASSPPPSSPDGGNLRLARRHNQRSWGNVTCKYSRHWI